VDGGTTYTIPFQDRGVVNDGFSNDAYGNELPTCNENDLSNCKNYMRAKGYVAIVKDGSNLLINIPTLPAGTPLRDLFYIQFDHLGWEEGEVAQVNIEVTGEPLFVGGPCTFRSDHERDWLTTLGPIIPGSGRWYNTCANSQWTVTFGASDISDFVYNRHGQPF
jgi:hypothetical protein